MRAGQVVAGRYRLAEPIGSGDTGVIWRAIDQVMGRVVALRRATRGADADSERTRRQLQREATIAAKLNHPHILAFLDEVTEGPERWLVMEHVPSQSLAQILDRTGPLLPRDVSRIGAQIASALEAVHARGIVHRDIKPGNVLVTEDGTAKLTDVGISRSICGDVTVTDSAVIVGTVAFLAPELANGEQSTPASDVFALGATLFAAVEGTPPFGTADNPLLVLRRAAAGDLLPIRRAGPLTPALSALLHPNPVKRPDATGVWQMLQELAATLIDDDPQAPSINSFQPPNPVDVDLVYFDTNVLITIYLSDESAHEQVEAAVEDLLASAGGHIDHRDDPVYGSWFRRMRAKIGEARYSPLAREAAALAAHAAESRLVLAQDATVTATMLQNLGPVLSALQPTKDAVIRAGALLIVKVDGIVVVHQLTSAQQLQLDHQPQLAQSPQHILSALKKWTASTTPSAAAADGACGCCLNGKPAHFRITPDDDGIPAPLSTADHQDFRESSTG